MKKQKLSIGMSLLLTLFLITIIPFLNLDKREDSFSFHNVPLVCFDNQGISTHIPDTLVCTKDNETTADYLVEDSAPTDPFSLPSSIDPEALLLDQKPN